MHLLTTPKASQNTTLCTGVRLETYLYIHSTTAQGLLSSSPFKCLYHVLCCSKKRKVAMVCGPSRTNAGTQPLNIQLTPSSRIILVSSGNTPSLLLELITLVLTTSTGLHTVVATKPARKLAEKCVVNPSFIPTCSSSSILKLSYEANCDAVINTARRLLAPTPRNPARHPSSFHIRYNPSTALR